MEIKTRLIYYKTVTYPDGRKEAWYAYPPAMVYGPYELVIQFV